MFLKGLLNNSHNAVLVSAKDRVMFFAVAIRSRSLEPCKSRLLFYTRIIAKELELKKYSRVKLLKVSGFQGPQQSSLQTNE